MQEANVHSQAQVETYSGNIISNIIMIIGILIALTGIGIGIFIISDTGVAFLMYMLADNQRDTIKFVHQLAEIFMYISWTFGVVTGMIFIGFGEIIRLLNHINYRVR